jgi:hypothetical protein
MLLGFAVTIEAPSHVKRLGEADYNHLIDTSMA